MPLFSATSHVQINGGNFIETGGDFNLQSTQPLGSTDSMLTGLDFLVDEDSNRLQLSAETDEITGGASMVSYCVYQELWPLIYL